MCCQVSENFQLTGFFAACQSPAPSFTFPVHIYFNEQILTMVQKNIYLRPVEDGGHRQHGDDDEDVCTAAHVTGHDEHLGEGRVKGKLHHQTACWCQSTWKDKGKSNYKVRCVIHRSTWEATSTGGISLKTNYKLLFHQKPAGIRSIMRHLFIYLCVWEKNELLTAENTCRKKKESEIKNFAVSDLNDKTKESKKLTMRKSRVAEQPVWNR